MKLAGIAQRVEQRIGNAQTAVRARFLAPKFERVKRRLHYCIGWVGVKLCNFSRYRPITEMECASSIQYASAMIAYMEMHGQKSAGEWQLRQFHSWMNDIKQGALVN